MMRDDNIVKKTDLEDNIFNLNDDILFNEEFSIVRVRRNILFDQGMDNNDFGSRSRFNILPASF